MIDQELLQILVCPETRQPLKLLDLIEIERLNTKIGQNLVFNRAGEKITEPIEAALVREDGMYAYPVRRDIPIMLIDESVKLDAAS